MLKLSLRTTILHILIRFLIVIFAIIVGFALGKNSLEFNDSASPTVFPPDAEVLSQHLIISATTDENTDFTVIPPEELGGNYNNKITYLGLRNVTISLNGTVMKLEHAIRDGIISIDEIISYARLDAKCGFCVEIPESNNGLTKLTYHYPEFDLWTVYDIYETPDGKQHLISDFGLCATGRNVSFLYSDDKTGMPIDYEDWGLTFEVTKVCPTAITLNCTQSGGQQIGELIVEYYTLYKSVQAEDVEEYVEPLVHDFSGESDPHFSISRNNTTEITIDFMPLHGELPTGSYILYLSITDLYSKEDIHPLMKNFYDTQRYAVAFTIE